MALRRWSLLILMLLSLSAFLVGCGNAKDSKAASPAADKNTILIQSYKFQPAELTIQKGDTVTWINQDSVGHTVTGAGLDSGLLTKGQSFKFTFTQTGVFEYLCSPHPSMKGKIIVQ